MIDSDRYYKDVDSASCVMTNGTRVVTSLPPRPTELSAAADGEAVGETEVQPTSLRADILDAAAACVLTDRQKTHGAPENTFGMIAAMWSAYLGVKIEPHEVCSMMSLLKIARSKAAPNNMDNWVDNAGYSACGGELAIQYGNNKKD
jgi:hypothetical protein